MDDVIPEANVETSRRTVVGGLLGLGIGAPMLVACGSDDSDSGEGSGNGESGGGSGNGESGGGAASGSIGKASDVPVGGAKIFAAEKVLVSQPTEGEFKAFSTVCTHRQCVITKLDGDEIECGCHFSRFSVEDGSVAKGPAEESLEELTVTVQGQDLVLG
jgi:nitrite reductase/ring-hydroxylating ferredoxin subunit